jgi:hypothetical protein
MAILPSRLLDRVLQDVVDDSFGDHDGSVAVSDDEVFGVHQLPADLDGHAVPAPLHSATPAGPSMITPGCRRTGIAPASMSMPVVRASHITV